MATTAGGGRGAVTVVTSVIQLTFVYSTNTSNLVDHRGSPPRGSTPSHHVGAAACKQRTQVIGLEAAGLEAAGPAWGNRGAV